MVGTEVHHIVEQTPAKKEGFSKELIEGVDNLVRIYYFKHREISDWYSSVNNESPYNVVTLRDFLRNKTWSEKRALGVQKLKNYGDLKK